jgi:hypothetical protein
MPEEVKTELHEEKCSDEHYHHHHEHGKHHHHHGAQGGVVLGPLWFMGWLFTLGFLHPTFWKGVLAIIIWPYYLGQWVQVLHAHNLTTLVR